MTEIPNLQKLEKEIEPKALSYAKSQGVAIEQCIADRKVEVWSQKWEGDATGITEEYITIFTYEFYDSREQEKHVLYSCTYGTNSDNGFLAMKEEMDENFFRDMKAHNVITLQEVIEKYQP